MLRAVFIQYGTRPFLIERVTSFCIAEEARGFRADTVIFERLPDLEDEAELNLYLVALDCLSHSTIREVSVMEVGDEGPEEKLKKFLFWARHLSGERAALQARQEADQVTLTVGGRRIETTVEVFRSVWSAHPWDMITRSSHLRWEGDLGGLFRNEEVR